MDTEYGGPVEVVTNLKHYYNEIGRDVEIIVSNNLFSFFKNLKKIKKPHILHFHGIWCFYQSLYALYAKVRGIKYFITPHGMLEKWALNQGKFKKQIYLKLIEQSVIEGADKIHFLNIEEKNLSLNINEKTIIIPNGVQLPKLKLDELIKQKTKKNYFQFLFLGRLHPKKNIPLMLEVLKKFKTLSNLNFRLIIAGPGEEKYLNELKLRINKLNLHDYVEFRGLVKGEEKAKLFETSDLFILLSKHEGDSIAIKEALSYGVPVVISEECHLNQVKNEDIGLIIDLKSTKSEQLLLDFFERQSFNFGTISKKSRKFIEDEFSWNIIAKKYNMLYFNEDIK